MLDTTLTMVGLGVLNGMQGPTHHITRASSACTGLVPCVMVPPEGQSMQGFASITLACAKRWTFDFIFT